MVNWMNVCATILPVWLYSYCFYQICSFQKKNNTMLCTGREFHHCLFHTPVHTLPFCVSHVLLQSFKEQSVVSPKCTVQQMHGTLYVPGIANGNLYLNGLKRPLSLVARLNRVGILVLFNTLLHPQVLCYIIRKVFLYSLNANGFMWCEKTYVWSSWSCN